MRQTAITYRRHKALTVTERATSSRHSGEVAHVSESFAVLRQGSRESSNTPVTIASSVTRVKGVLSTEQNDTWNGGGYDS